MQDDTSPPTLWSHTLLEILIFAVRRGRDADAYKVLWEIRDKGYGKGYVLKFAADKLDGGQLAHLERLIKTMRNHRPGAADERAA